ncbi:MAG TPA: hypothetical protein VGI79_08575 [Caulobacteraceae bacterium]|jgi:hypothetical protein
MPAPSEAEIHAFLQQQVRFWNEGRRQDMTDLYRTYAYEDLTIEYVGQPIGDGWKTYDHMWDAYGGKVKVELVEVLVNGSEAAYFARNVRLVGGAANPSIETYRFEPGRLHIRYFHRTDTQ